jgi:hypothetical protein
MVRQRMQYFPDGGAAIGPVDPAAGAAYVAGVPRFVRSGGFAKPNAGGTEGPVFGGGGGGVPSAWGRVKPHLAQKRAPSGPISPQ